MSATLERPQHLVALEQADRIRLEMAALKASLRQQPDIYAGRHALAYLLEHPTDVAKRMRILDLMMAPRRQGRKLSLRFLRPMQINEQRLVGELTERQRKLLAAKLREDRAS